MKKRPGRRPWQDPLSWHAIGRRIERAAHARGVGLSELAERLDVSPSLISKWIYGRGCPSSAFVELLVEHLVVSREYILNGGGPSELEIEGILQLKSQQEARAAKAKQAARDGRDKKREIDNEKARQAHRARIEAAEKAFEERGRILARRKLEREQSNKRLSERFKYTLRTVVPRYVKCVQCDKQPRFGSALRCWECLSSD